MADDRYHALEVKGGKFEPDSPFNGQPVQLMVLYIENLLVSAVCDVLINLLVYIIMV